MSEAGGSTVSGVGYNVALALHTLGSQVALLSLVGSDPVGGIVREDLAARGLGGEYVLSALEPTPQSVILFDREGRQINTDLKDIQERDYPPELFERALAWCDVAVAANINFSRPLLPMAREAGKLVATDVHAISSLDDAYNHDFMRYADVLFMSHERLPVPREELARNLVGKYGTEVVVVGLGSEGALLSVRGDGFLGRVPAARTRKVVSTIGAGDALFAAFVHFFSASRDPYSSLRKAVLFASYKIGATGAVEGFLTEAELDALSE